MMLPAGHWQVLQKILACLQALPQPWALTGSAGMALQGMPLDVHDIDIQTGKTGAYEIERRLLSLPGANTLRPVEFTSRQHMRSHLGCLELDGIEVEIMGDIQKRADDGCWQPPVQVEDHRCMLDLDGWQIPVLDLEYEYRAYLRMGRTEKAALIRAWLDGRR